MTDLATDPHGLVGQTIASQFQMLRTLGSGGMGTVYLAEQIDMQRPVALKVLHPQLSAGSPTAIERFKREGRIVARLNHPHIVQVYVFGQIEGSHQLYLAMEYVDGQTLTQTMSSGKPMAVSRVLRIADQVLAALIEAHGQGLVHRDLKPDNIMLTERHGSEDYVKVLDFGIAKMIEERSSTVTEAGALFGTPRYMSPEQARGELVDGRTDLYSLGVVLYELLCTEHPFRAQGPLDFLVKHQSEPVPHISEQHPEREIPVQLSDFIYTCMQKKREDRYASASQARRAIHAAMADLPSGLRPWPTPDPVGLFASGYRPASSARRFAFSHRARRWIMPLSVLLGFGLTWTLTHLWGERDPAEPAATEPTSAASGQAAALQSERAGPAQTTLAPTDAGAPTAPSAQPDAQPAEAQPVTTRLKAGENFEGLRLPAGAQVQSQTGSIVSVFVESMPQEILNYFHVQAQLNQWAPLRRVPQILYIEDPRAPFSQIFVMSQPHGALVSLTRSTENMVRASSLTQPIFDTPVYADARLVSQSGDVVVYSVRAQIEQVFDHYLRHLGGIDGVTVQRRDGDEPSLYVSALQAKTAWASILVTPNRLGPAGSVQVIVTGRERPR